MAPTHRTQAFLYLVLKRVMCALARSFRLCSISPSKLHPDRICLGSYQMAEEKRGMEQMRTGLRAGERVVAEVGEEGWKPGP